MEESDDLEAESGNVRLADRASVPVVFALAKLVQQATPSDNAAEQRKAVLGAAQQLAQLRRGNHEAERVRLETERWEAKQQELRATKCKEAEQAARAVEFRRRYFPGLDENFMPLPAGAIPEELQTCLTANALLRQAAIDRGDLTESK